MTVGRPDGNGRPRKRLDSLCADKAYGSRANRRALRARRIPYDIPEKDDQIANRLHKGSRGGRPPNFSPERYRQRNHVERLFNRRKQFRAVAIRYDKLACRYRATVQIAAYCHLVTCQARPAHHMIQETHLASSRSRSVVRGGGRSSNRMTKAGSGRVPFGLLVHSPVMICYAVSGYHPNAVAAAMQAEPLWEARPSCRSRP